MHNSRIEILHGDITRLSVNAVVNAANSSLMGGGGVDGAIHRAAGPSLHQECVEIVNRQGRLPVGKAVITGAGNMPSRFVIHTVGPLWNGGTKNEDEHLADCYRNCLKLAIENNIRTIAFPNISTGVYGFPKEKDVIIAIREANEFLENNDCFEKIIFCCFDEENYKLYKNYT